MTAEARDRRPEGAVSAGDGRFRIGDRAASVYGAAMHYWRLDRDVWGPILDRLKAGRLTMVSIYIPWEVHEAERGRFDFGANESSNGLDAFLTMCEERDLYVVTRRGPQINGELTWFGYPRRPLPEPLARIFATS